MKKYVGPKPSPSPEPTKPKKPKKPGNGRVETGGPGWRDINFPKGKKK